MLLCLGLLRLYDLGVLSYAHHYEGILFRYFLDFVSGHARALDSVRRGYDELREDGKHTSIGEWAH